MRENYLPPIPDRLYDYLNVEGEEEEDSIYGLAVDILRTLQRVSLEERDLIFNFFLHGCATELPENLHINLDLLRRLSGFSPSRIERVLGQLRSLSIFCSIREGDVSHEHLGQSRLLVLEWHVMREGGGNATEVASEMIDGAVADYCEACGMEALSRLDFGQLASATVTQDHH